MNDWQKGIVKEQPCEQEANDCLQTRRTNSWLRCLLPSSHHSHPFRLVGATFGVKGCPASSFFPQELINFSILERCQISAGLLPWSEPSGVIPITPSETADTSWMKLTSHSAC